jgi:hypothetical protein
MRSAVVFLLAGLTWAGPDLQPPFAVQSGGEPINVEIGHAAPFVADWDGDGVRDLLVGQFGDGRLRIYRNVGTNKEPAFQGFTLFGGKVPTG